MYQWMTTRHGTVTTAFLDKNRSLPDLPFIDDGVQSVTTYMKVHHIGPHKVAAENNEPMPQTVKVSKLTKGLAPCGEFKAVFEHFVFAHPTPAVQTFELLSGLVRTYDEGRVARKTSVGSGLMNQAVSADQSAIQTLVEQVAQLQSAIAVLTANAARGPAPAADNNGHKHANTSGLTNPKSHYCWSHGPNTSHCSGDCDFPRDGHQKKATFGNKLGGAIVFTSGRTGGGRK
jgi:hypothetical protein